MAGLTTQERLQPSLLDRLTDHEPGSAKESLEARVLNKKQLREAVLRDLSWLFNACAQEPPPHCPDRERVRMWMQAPHALQSVLNFGIPSLTGMTVSLLDFPAIEEAIRVCVARFEPRIDEKTLSVKIQNDLSTGLRPTALRLTIKGQLWNQPVPLELLLSADVDVDTGQAAVRDLRH
ncbi:MAG: type VI secretion system baseplate subunit TssE [Piscinibacter sp.]|nr:type VI secretion system baseplate subunit TssE [Piscinibacter sp.]